MSYVKIKCFCPPNWHQKHIWSQKVISHIKCWSTLNNILQIGMVSWIPWCNRYTHFFNVFNKPSYHIVIIVLLHITPMVSMIVMKLIVCSFHCSFTTSGFLSSCTIFMIAHSSMLIIFLFLFLHGVLGATKILVFFYVSLTLKRQHLGLLSCHVVFMLLQLHVIYVASYALMFFSHQHYVSFYNICFQSLFCDCIKTIWHLMQELSRINMLIENEQ